MLSETEMKRLRWRCTHRAQLEMDLLLGHFLDRHFTTLSAEQEAAFVTLAELEDIELWPLVIGKRASRNPVETQVLAMLRQVRDD
ncbi:MAG: succinate dehydrogenase assembly factor 2 [Candidatus Accumulibacter sp.]|jgi:succinate dehydrogenase flavin-adding protein (antitoxin of CptAB toxin-antitoxin module)|nr:succinate dehydrogenase assembly factor 2 [Accumulibacter sp.]